MPYTVHTACCILFLYMHLNPLFNRTHKLGVVCLSPFDFMLGSHRNNKDKPLFSPFPATYLHTWPTQVQKIELRGGGGFPSFILFISTTLTLYRYVHTYFLAECVPKPFSKYQLGSKSNKFKFYPSDSNSRIKFNWLNAPLSSASSILEDSLSGDSHLFM